MKNLKVSMKIIRNKIISKTKEKFEEKQELVYQDKTHSKVAIEHVNSLKNWEKKTLPKIGK